MAMVPIWKDLFFNHSTQWKYFKVVADQQDGETIYAGSMSGKPGASSVDIGVNSICANYILHSDINFDAAINSTRVSRFFYVFLSSNGISYILADTVEFQADWSYDYNYNPSRDGLQFPITLFADARQRIMRTVLSGSYITATLHYPDGSTFEIAVTVNRSDDFNNDYNDDYSRTAESFPGVAMVDLADYPGIDSITMEGITWKVGMDGCFRYALYYINAYGGWDTLLCRANGMEADNWKRLTFSKTYDNRYEQNRGVEDYVNEQSKRWTLRTGWLDDMGASRMHNLLGSVMVYLHDLQEDRILPVGVTTTDAPYKTYKNNGAKLVSYEFEVALQQERVRR